MCGCWQATLEVAHAAVKCQADLSMHRQLLGCRNQHQELCLGFVSTPLALGHSTNVQGFQAGCVVFWGPTFGASLPLGPGLCVAVWCDFPCQLPLVSVLAATDAGKTYHQNVSVTHPHALQPLQTDLQ
jgi:hypothetical protein